MTEIDYLRKHPLDFTVGNGSARVRMFVCPITEGGCDDHPVLQMHEPVGTPDADVDALPFKSVISALGWLLKTASEVIFDSVLSKPEALRATEAIQGGFDIASEATKYYNDMSAAIKRSTLN